MRNSREEAVVNSLDVDPKQPVEVSFARGIGPAYVGYPRVVDQYMNGTLCRNGADYGYDLFLIRYIDRVGFGLTASSPDVGHHLPGLRIVEFEDVHQRPRLRKRLRNGQPNATGPTRYQRGFVL